MLFRLDGHSFHRKPNDVRALELMDHAARSSDEYSFLLKRSTSLYNRRCSKIVSDPHVLLHFLIRRYAPINNLYNTTFWALVQQGGQTTTEAHATLRGTFSKDKHEILFSRFQINYNQLDARYRKGSVLDPEPPAEEREPSTGDSTPRAAPFATESKPSPVEKNEKKKSKERKKGKPPTTITLLHCDIIRDEFWNERPGLLAE
ncbi:tRNAHis guanylyltransferase [Coprinellus micaceus]|uniref:tRNA(His) guanylyltransferase n=1 Tax=Coprinellus micaceus TaxID=71717 RepID=A0A4Y7SD41_COPMI|nr:tRNAHis guanylyltransferase [Coprinellus micaceus]